MPVLFFLDYFNSSDVVFCCLFINDRKIAWIYPGCFAAQKQSTTGPVDIQARAWHRWAPSGRKHGRDDCLPPDRRQDIGEYRATIRRKVTGPEQHQIIKVPCISSTACRLRQKSVRKIHHMSLQNKLQIESCAALTNLVSVAAWWKYNM